MQTFQTLSSKFSR